MITCCQKKGGETVPHWGQGEALAERKDTGDKANYGVLF